MKILQEFRQFIQRGNVIDMAVGVIMGAAFNKIVTSLVADVVLPPVGWLIGGVQFTDLKVTLPQITVNAGVGNTVLKPATINYGQFLQVSLDFVLTAGCIFLLVKAINALHRKLEAEPPPPAPPPPTPTEKLLMEIRDLLQSRNPDSPSATGQAGENPQTP